MTAVGGRRTASKKGADYFPTPSWATEALLAYEDFDGTIHEPCCGEGYMSKVLMKHDYGVISSDKYDYGYGKVRDAFELKKATNIVTNPPFNIATELAKHFVSITTNKVCLLLRLSFLESEARYKFFKKYSPSRIYVFTQRLSLYPAHKKNVSGSGTIAYAWFVWDNKEMCGDTLLKWIKPGFKRKGLK